ncbi:MAG: efflux RND transporter periplasmic adaptor subunit [Flavobacteriaceae bacterium]|nr:efflux RND transporter periplasmic adaptor subunit [Flavobacteriaceae bacterium]
MRTKYTYLMLLLLFIISACNTETKQEAQTKATKVIVETTAVKLEKRDDLKSYFGELRFSKSTNFVAQQSGVVTKLHALLGQKVIRGKAIVAYPPIDYQLQIEQAKIQKNKTFKDYNRQIELFNAGAVSKVSVDDYKAQFEIDNKTLEQLNNVNVIKAPFTGIITQLYVAVGQEINAGEPVFSMAQQGEVEVQFYVTSNEIKDIHINANVFFIINKEKIYGKISKKAMQLDEQRRAFMVTASFETNTVMYAGNTIDIMVEIGQPKARVWIPIDVFRKQNGQHYVYIVKDSIARQQNIVIGKRTETEVEVIKGLANGDEIVLSGIDKVSDGTAISIKNKKY